MDDPKVKLAVEIPLSLRTALQEDLLHGEMSVLFRRLVAGIIRVKKDQGIEAIAAFIRGRAPLMIPLLSKEDQNV